MEIRSHGYDMTWGVAAFNECSNEDLEISYNISFQEAQFAPGLKMHSMGLHSALAIKRQRKRRQDLKKAKGRRFSIQSAESGLGGSQSSCASPRNSLDGTERSRKKTMKSKVTSFETNVGIGMLQIGVVFVVLGVFLLGSILIPDDIDNWSWESIFTKKAWWNELVITGAFALLLGIFLIVLDRFISKREEDDLNEYVQGQLTRSRSGHRLVRDVETGNLVPRRTKTLTGINEKLQQELEELPVVHSPKVKTPPANYPVGNQAFINGETGITSPQLEKILEEDISVLMDGNRSSGMHLMQEEYDSTATSVSPGSIFEAHETQELIGSSHLMSAPPVRAETTINMMGAMPAVAVRLERRKAEQRLKRPSQLYLGGYPHLRQQATSPSRGNSPSPSPLLSPPRFEEDQRLPEVYVCGKVSALHLAVVSLLLGAVILIVGLVQLKPGADAPGHRYYLIGVGCFLEVLGLIITATRCVMLHMKIKRKRSSISSSSKKCEKMFHEPSSSQIEGKDPGILINGKSQNIPPIDSLTPSDLEIPKPVNLKQLYNSSDVMYIDEMSDTPDRKSKSPVESVNTIDVVMGATMQEPAPTFTDTCSLAKVSPIDFDNLMCQPSQKDTT